MSFALIAATVAISFNSITLPECVRLERSTYAMGTILRVAACSPSREAGIQAIEAGFAEVQRLERVLSSWRSDTEIARLNSASPGGHVTISTELAAILREADEWVRASNAAFDPAIGALIDVWGFRSNPRVPDPAHLQTALQATGWSHLRFANATTVVRGPAGWWLDTGGFGKGAALRSLASVLRDHDVPNAIIDFGGQLLVAGDPTQIEVADPAQRAQPVKALIISNASVSTSSQSERFIESAGRHYGHILDPRSGQPVPAWGSVTVVMQDAFAADALSTALFVMGAERALQWAQTRADVGVLVLEHIPNGGPRARWNAAMTQWLIKEKT